MLAVRTFGDPLTVLNAVRQKVREIDKDQPLARPITLKEILGFQTVQPRFNMALFSCFAALGLALAAIGIYSVISYGVAQRMHEIGVRMALGAKRSDVLVIVLRMVAKVAAIGLAIGLGGSIMLAADRAIPGVCSQFIRCRRARRSSVSAFPRRSACRLAARATGSQSGSGHSAPTRGLESAQKRDQIFLFLRRKSDVEPRVVEIHNVSKTACRSVMKIRGTARQPAQHRPLDSPDILPCSCNQRTSGIGSADRLNVVLFCKVNTGR